jgi:hypothetical protein
MTSTFIRPAIALALTLALAGCGGKASFPVSGTVFGRVYDGLVLTTNGMDQAVQAKATRFTFANTLSYGEVYKVVAKTQPQHQTCTVGAFVDANGNVYGAETDTAGRLAVINIGVNCTLNAAAVGGSITGLTSDGLSLTNGSTGGTVAPAAGATSFVMPAVEYGVSYGITVLTQPTGNVCSVSQNGSGVMGDAAVTDVVVTCVPK